MTTKQNRQTRQIEMVETHNIALSLRRLYDSGPYDSLRWKRAFYHALLMAHTSASFEEKALIRQALRLP